MHIYRVLRPPGGGSSITIGDDTPPPLQKAPARSPYAVEGDGVINLNKSAKDYTPSKPFGTEEDAKSSPQVSHYIIHFVNGKKYFVQNIA